MSYSPKPLTTQSDADRTARQFAGLVARVVNTTVSHDRVQVLPFAHSGDWTRWNWVVAALDGPSPRPIELTDGSWLLLEQRLGLREKSGDLWLTTLSYRYRWQADSDDGSWLIRWEYKREGAGAYPAAHLHVNASPERYAHEKHFGKLHLPTSRVPLEGVVRFLITEIGVEPISENWHETLTEAERVFNDIQRRAASDD